MANLLVSSNQDKAPVKERQFYFDLLRAFACMSVVMIHVSDIYVSWGRGDIGFWIGNLLDTLSRAAVPLFVMISGALMLDENYVFTKKKWLGHIGKMVLFLIFWGIAYSLVFKVIKPLILGKDIDIIEALRLALTGQLHLWFVPMIIGLYLLVPVLRIWVKKQNKRYIEYYLLLSLVFTSIIPYSLRVLGSFGIKLEGFSSLVDGLSMQHATGYVLYFILGWYLHNFELKKKKLIYTLGVIAVCVVFAGTGIIYAFADEKGFVFYDSLSVNMVLYAIAIFVFAKSAYGNKDRILPKGQRLVKTISKYSLGVYAIHGAFIDVCRPLLSRFSVFIALPAVFVLSLFLSLLLSFIMSKIPFLRRLV